MPDVFGEGILQAYASGKPNREWFFDHGYDAPTTYLPDEVMSKDEAVRLGLVPPESEADYYKLCGYVKCPPDWKHK